MGQQARFRMETLRGQSPGCPPRAWPSAAPAVSEAVWWGGVTRSEKAQRLPSSGILDHSQEKSPRGQVGRGGLVGRDSQASPLDQPQASCGLQSGGRASPRVTAGAAW